MVKIYENIKAYNKASANALEQPHKYSPEDEYTGTIRSICSDCGTLTTDQHLEMLRSKIADHKRKCRYGRNCF